MHFLLKVVTVCYLNKYLIFYTFIEVLRLELLHTRSDRFLVTLSVHILNTPTQITKGHSTQSFVVWESNL